MKCDLCDKPAKVHLCEIRNRKKTERHLCEACAGREIPALQNTNIEERLREFVEKHQKSPLEEPPKSRLAEDNLLHYGVSNGPKLWSRRRITLAAIAAAVGMAVNLLSYIPGQEFGRMLYPWPLLSLRVTRDALPSLVVLLSQFPLYGALIGFVWPTGLKARAAVVALLTAIHIAGIAVWLRVG